MSRVLDRFTHFKFLAILVSGNTENELTQAMGLDGFPGGGEGLLAIQAAVDNLGGWPVYEDVARTFLEQMPGVLQQLAAHTRPPAQLRSALHEAAGSLGAVGAIQASRIAQAIEATLRRGDPIDTVALAELRGAIDAAVAAVRAVLAERAGLRAP